MQIVLEDDPITLEPQALQDARPQFVVIALEAVIEDALERLEPALSAPGLTLVFDEAELAARRDGWEAQPGVWTAAPAVGSKGSFNTAAGAGGDDVATTVSFAGSTVIDFPVHIAGSNASRTYTIQFLIDGVVFQPATRSVTV